MNVQGVVVRIESSWSWDSETREMEIFYEEESLGKFNVPDFRTANIIGQCMERIRKDSIEAGKTFMRSKVMDAIGE